MDDLKRDVVYSEDGRKGERIVREIPSMAKNGDTVTETELYFEPKVQKKLAQKVTEFSRPMVHKRVVDVVNEETGEVVESRTESMFPEAKMELRDHTVYASSFMDQDSVEIEDCAVTRGELKDLLQGFASAIANNRGNSEPVAMRSLQAEVGERVEQSKTTFSGVAIFLAVVVAAQVAGLAYMMFWM